MESAINLPVKQTVESARRNGDQANQPHGGPVHPCLRRERCAVPHGGDTARDKDRPERTSGGHCPGHVAGFAASDRVHRDPARRRHGNLLPSSLNGAGNKSAHSLARLHTAASGLVGGLSCRGFLGRMETNPA